MNRPLYVDLDQTLIRTDVLWEMAAQLACRHPARLLWLLWSCRGNLCLFKGRLAGAVELPAEGLPLNKGVVDIIKCYRKACGPVFLATATHETAARGIAAWLGLFDDVLATTDHCNLKGEAKLEAIRRHCAGLGAGSFAYIGDSAADIPIWREAGEAWVVARPGGRVAKAAQRAGVRALKAVPQPSREAKRAWLRLLRPSQWSKNALLFLPLILAHRAQEVPLVSANCLAFVAFSFTASAVYIFNDFSDVSRDRAHPRKRFRPLAAGEIPLWQAPLASAALLAVAAGISYYSIGLNFSGILAVYLASNLLYTFSIKHRPVVDVVGLALMYTLRIFAGGMATGLEVSKWLMTFSMFFFLSLAFGKRYQEIAPVAVREDIRCVRGYTNQDLPVIAMSGLASGLISVLVLALYVRSPEVLPLYLAPDVLWLLCPLVIYWIGRFWLLTGRGYLHDDPVVFALKDRTSWIIACLMLGVLTAAQFAPYFRQLLRNMML